MKRFGCTFVPLLLIALGAIWGYRMLHPARIGGTPFAELSPAEQQERRQDVQKLEDQLSDLKKANDAQQHKPYTVTVTSADLNTLLQDSIQIKNLPVSNLRAELQPGQVILQGDANYKGFNAPATVTGSLSPRDDGGVAFEVVSLNLGNFPAPDKWKDKIRKPVEKQLDKLFRSGHGGRVESITIEQDRMTVQGVTR